MKCLADANISNDIAAFLRDAGHEVVSANSLPPAMADLDLLLRAAERGQCVLTSDKDFGDLVFLHRIAAPGVVLIRLPRLVEHERTARRLSAWPAIVARLPGCFVTLTETGIRVRRIARCADEAGDRPAIICERSRHVPRSPVPDPRTLNTPWASKPRFPPRAS